ncbi:MAG: helix-turn-helix transcriptional regulator [Lentisphaeria bacterium]|nr:helix-turn-helix transcriptional regulator [Lentisphaeria bacterium]
MNRKFFVVRNYKQNGVIENVYHIYGSALTRIPSLLSLEAYGESHLQAGAETFAMTTSSSILELVTGGNGTVEYMGKVFSVKAGDLIFTSVPEKLVIKNTSNSILTKKYLNFYLSSGILSPFSKKNDFAKNSFFHLVHDCMEADYFFDKIRALLTGEKNPLIYFELSGLCLSLVQMAGSFNTPVDEQRSSTVTMELFPGYFGNVKSIRNKLNMSQKKLYKYYHEKFHTSPMAYQISCRLNQAYSCLTTQDLPIGEIAALCGYNSLPFFSREFKKKFGYSPSVFRKKFAEGSITPPAIEK